MAYIPPVRAGDLITEGLLNRIVDQIERFATIRSSSPYILIDDGPHGKLIELDLPVQTWALLSGASSPYSFEEVRDGPGGTWVSMPNGDSGTANVYEVNNKSGLAGKVVPITWTAAGDWRFQWVGYSSECHLGPCTESVPEVLVLDDVNLALTLPFIFTPDNPSVPCVGKWIAYDMVEFGGSSHPDLGDCPPSTVAVRWRMTLPSTTGGNPVMDISWHRTGSCPAGGTIPAGSWDTVIPGNVGSGYVADSWNCPPGFAADFRSVGNLPIYNFLPSQILVSTPP